MISHLTASFSLRFLKRRCRLAKISSTSVSAAGGRDLEISDDKFINYFGDTKAMQFQKQNHYSKRKPLCILLRPCEAVLRGSGEILRLKHRLSTALPLVVSLVSAQPCAIASSATGSAQARFPRRFCGIVRDTPASGKLFRMAGHTRKRAPSCWRAETRLCLRLAILAFKMAMPLRFRRTCCKLKNRHMIADNHLSFCIKLYIYKNLFTTIKIIQFSRSFAKKLLFFFA